MAIPRGWHYIPGTLRRVVIANDGSRHTRQDAENTFARQWGFANEYERKRAANSSGYKAFTNRPGHDRGINEARGAGYTKAEAEAVFAKFYQNQDRNSRDRSPDGPLAEMLVVMGRRSSGDPTPVGESPSIH